MRCNIDLGKIGNSISCTGCMLCREICPREAITIRTGELGFVYPQIVDEKCVKCGKCVEICPIEERREKFLVNKCYAMQAEKEIRKKCSSGGMFYILAEAFLQCQGYVCGAEIKKDQIRHRVIRSVEELPYLCKSKYVQSSLDGIYRQIKEILNNGKKVLFAGTPCQCEAIKRYCDDDENLYLIDVLCMGVPSQELFSKYLNENFRFNYDKIDFRFKIDDRWEPRLFLSIGNEKNQRIIEDKDSSYYSAFLKTLSIRRSCTECIFAGSERVGDISLGDFWGIREYDPRLDDGYGTSLVLINSSKGRYLIDLCKNNIRQSSEVPIDFVLKKNSILSKPVGNSYSRKLFVENYGHMSVNGLVESVLRKKADCGIINYWFKDNSGGILTAYALQLSLEKMGYSSLLIDVGITQRNPNGISKRFETKYLKTTLPIYQERLASLNDRFKCFIVGSDQVFRREWVPDSFFLDFVNNRNKKIAVSVSFGTDSLNCSIIQKREMSYWLKRFDALSCRELSGIKLFEQLGVDGQYIIDPVFWMDAEEYISNLKLTRQYGDYIAIYFKDTKNKQEKFIKTIREVINDKIIVLDDNTEVESFLQYISAAKLLITDSYYGVCFAIIFHTEFLCNMNELEGNAQLDSLVETLGISRNRFILNYLSISDMKWDNLSSNWDEIDNRIVKQRDIAIRWLSNALSEKKSIRTFLSPIIYCEKNKINDDLGKKKYYLKKRIGIESSNKLVCYGAGYCGYRAITLFEGKIDFFIDRDSSKKWFEGYHVYTLREAKRIMNVDTPIVLTVNKDKQDEIRYMLEREGYRNVFGMDSYIEGISDGIKR